MDMRRPAQILAELEAARAVGADELATEFGVSKRTIAAEIASLQDALGTAASITQLDGRYRLLVADPERYRALSAALKGKESSFNDPAARASHIVARLFTALTPVRIDQLALDMSVGRTTVVTDIARVRQIVAEADLRIEGRPNVGLILQGPELLQRLHVLRHHFAAAYDYPERLAEVEALATKVAGDASLDPGYAPEVARWATMALDRARTGRALDGLPHGYSGVRSTPAFDFAQALSSRLAERYQIALSDDDVLFLALPVVGVRAPGQRGSASSSSVGGEADDLVQEVLAAVSLEMDIHLGDSQFVAEFARHLAFMLNRMRYRIWVDDSGMANIRHEFPVAYRMATVASDVVRTRIGMPVEDAEIAFLATYFQVFLEDRGSQPLDFLRVAVVASTGRVTAELVRLQLAKVLPPTSLIRVITPTEATPEGLAELDLVVVTGDADITCAAPVVHVTRVLDRPALERQLDRLQLKLPLHLASTQGTSVLAGALDEDHFFALPHGTDYAEGVEYMLGQLEARGLIDADFAERIREREAQAHMQLDPWVGFPHATLGSAQGLMLAVGVVPRDSADDGVRLIVLLGVPADPHRSAGVLVAVYDEVLRLGARRDLIDGMCRVTTYEDFYYFTENNPLAER